MRINFYECFFISPLIFRGRIARGTRRNFIFQYCSRPSVRFIEDDLARERNRRSGRRSLRCERSAIPNHLWALLDDGLNYKRRSDPSDLPRLRCRRRRGGSSLTWPSRSCTRSRGNRKRSNPKECRSAEIKADSVIHWARAGYETR